MKSSRVVNGEGTGMYTAGIGFMGSHSGSLCAIAPAYRWRSTVPNGEISNHGMVLTETDHSQSLPPLKLRETLPCLFFYNVVNKTIIWRRGLC